MVRVGEEQEEEEGEGGMLRAFLNQLDQAGVAGEQSWLVGEEEGEL